MFSLFKKKEPIVEEEKEEVNTNPILFTSHGDNCWGNAISWKMSRDDVLVDEVGKEQRFHGWKSRRPVTGDYIQVPMRSGRHFLYKVTEYRHETDPPDMFFCTGVFLGYSEDVEKVLAAITEERDAQ